MELISSINKEFMEINSSIGERLREVREGMGKTQSDFAEIAAVAGVPGATRQSQAKYEKGLAAPTAAYMAAIAAAGADVLYVITGQRSGGYVPPPALKPDEAALVDNYRHSPASEQALLRQTSAAFARSAGRKSA